MPLPRRKPPIVLLSEVIFTQEAIPSLWNCNSLQSSLFGGSASLTLWIKWILRLCNNVHLDDVLGKTSILIVK